MYNDGFSYPIVVAIDNIQTGESHVLGRDVRISYISNEFAKIAYPIAFNQFHSTTSNYSQASESKWQGYSAYSTLTYGIIYADSINNNYIGSCSFITIGY